MNSYISQLKNGNYYKQTNKNIINIVQNDSRIYPANKNMFQEINNEKVSELIILNNSIRLV